MTLYSWRSRRHLSSSIRLLFLLFLVVLILRATAPSLQAGPLILPSSPPPSPHPICADIYNLYNTSIAIVLKTGHSELLHKVPPLLQTYLSCAVPDLLLFSDLYATLGPLTIHDALSSVRAPIVRGHPHFELYYEQYAANGLRPPVFDRPFSWSLDRVFPWLRSQESVRPAWDLDRFKLLHVAQRAWDLLPDRDWYLFIEADTYVEWSNVFTLLHRYDQLSQPRDALPLASSPNLATNFSPPPTKWYLGSLVRDGLPQFAHGGSGYALSRSAMSTLVGPDRDAIALRYDVTTVGGCCGDQELARSLLDEAGIAGTNVRPVINGEFVGSIAYGGSREKEWWCSPMGTLHHVDEEEVREVWRWQVRRVLEGLMVSFDEYHDGFAGTFGIHLEAISGDFGPLLRGRWSRRRLTGFAWANQSRDSKFGVTRRDVASQPVNKLTLPPAPGPHNVLHRVPRLPLRQVRHLQRQLLRHARLYSSLLGQLQLRPPPTLGARIRLLRRVRRGVRRRRPLLHVELQRRGPRVPIGCHDSAWEEGG